MLVNEIAKKCNITKKAVQYYVEEGLLDPKVFENGYRDFSEQDEKRLKQIVLYRKLGLSINDIKRVMNNPNEITGILYKKTLELEQEKIKQEILKKVEAGERLENLEKEINHINSNTIIINKLLELFPSYYGKFISLNFAAYLTGKIETEEQMKAFHEIIEFFDNAPELELTPELQAYMDEYLELYSSEEGIENINSIIKGKHDAMQDINAFVKDNKEILDEYHRFKQSEAYKTSPAYQLMEVMKAFCETSGYYDVFIPAMRRLSSTYDAYYVQMLKANEEFVRIHPEYCKE